MFTKTVFDNKTEKYTVNGKETTKDEGNALYRKLMSNKGTTVTKEIVTMTYEEKIKSLEASIDPYTWAIDNYQQEKAAEALNRRLEQEIEFFKNLIKERDNENG